MKSVTWRIFLSSPFSKIKLEMDGSLKNVSASFVRHTKNTLSYKKCRLRLISLRHLVGFQLYFDLTFKSL